MCASTETAPDPTADSPPGIDSDPPETYRPDLKGDGWDPEPLLTASELSEKLSIPQKAVYSLPIPRIRISERRVRWRPEDVTAWLEKRREKSA